MGRRGQSKQCEKAAHMPLTAMREHGRSRSTRRQQAVIHTRQGQRTKGKDAMDTGPVGCGRRPDNQHTGEVSWEEPAAPDPLRFRHPPRLPLGCRGAKRRQKQRHRTPSSRRHHRQVLLVPILSGFLPLSISSHTSSRMCQTAGMKGLLPLFSSQRLLFQTPLKSLLLYGNLLAPPWTTWTNRPLSQPYVIHWSQFLACGEPAFSSFSR